MRSLRVAVFFLCVGFARVSFGQATDCEVTLNQAFDEFNAGHFYSISTILAPCMNKFTKEQRQRANLLLTQTYLLLDNPAEAEKSYLKLLQANPEFTVDESRDPIDVVFLSKKFTADPIFSLQAKIGMNTAPVRVIRSEFSSGSQSKSDFKLQAGWQVGVGAEWHVYDELSLNLEATYVAAGFKGTRTIFPDDNSIDLQEVIDRQNWLLIPVSIKYSYTEGKYRPYTYLGASFDWLFDDKARIVTNNRSNQNGATLEAIAESPTLDFSYRRNKLNRSFFIGSGLKVKFKLDYLFVDLRYSFGLTNLLNADAQYVDNSKTTDPTNNTSTELQESGDPNYRYAYVDDFFRLDNLSVSVGYIKPLYKPRKLKKARTKSLFKQIRKSDETK